MISLQFYFKRHCERPDAIFSVRSVRAYSAINRPGRKFPTGPTIYAHIPLPMFAEFMPDDYMS